MFIWKKYSRLLLCRKHVKKTRKYKNVIRNLQATTCPDMLLMVNMGILLWVCYCYLTYSVGCKNPKKKKEQRLKLYNIDTLIRNIFSSRGTKFNWMLDKNTYSNVRKSVGYDNKKLPGWNNKKNFITVLSWIGTSKPRRFSSKECFSGVFFFFNMMTNTRFSNFIIFYKFNQKLRK